MCFLPPDRPADNFFRNNEQFPRNMNFTGIQGPRTLNWEKVCPGRRKLVLGNVVYVVSQDPDSERALPGISRNSASLVRYMAS